VIAKTISLPFMVIDQREQDFWKLQFILKWQPEYNNPKKMKPLLDKLTLAFTELGYREPGTTPPNMHWKAGPTVCAWKQNLLASTWSLWNQD
jgi:hypothetical protein